MKLGTQNFSTQFRQVLAIFETSVEGKPHSADSVHETVPLLCTLLVRFW